MKALYFNPKKYTVPISALNWLMLKMDRHIPTINQFLLRSLLMKPRMQSPKTMPTIFQQANEENFNFQGRRIKTYYWKNTGPIVFLVHGWAGDPSQFTALIERLLSQGYSIFTYDQIAHGHSQGKQANIVLFTLLLQQLIPHVLEYGKIHAIMAHSLAGAAALNLVDQMAHINHLILFSPLTFVENSLRNSTSQLGIHRDLMTSLIRNIERQHQTELKFFDPSKQNKKPSTNVHLLHCKNDRLVPITDTEKYKSTRSNFFKNLEFTEQLGHRRILKDPTVISTVLTWLQS